MGRDVTAVVPTQRTESSKPQANVLPTLVPVLVSIRKVRPGMITGLGIVRYVLPVQPETRTFFWLIYTNGITAMEEPGTEVLVYGTTSLEFLE